MKPKQKMQNKAAFVLPTVCQSLPQDAAEVEKPAIFKEKSVTDPFS